MFYDNFLSLCEDAGQSPSSLLESLGLSKGSLNRWRKGAEPTNESKKIIADHFGIAVKELMFSDLGIKKAPAADVDSERVSEFTKAIMELTPAEIAEVMNYMDYLKSKRQ